MKYHSVRRDVISFCGWPFLLEFINSTSGNLRAFISALFETGGRVSEVLQLRKEHFDLSTHPDLVIIRNMPLLKRFKKVGEIPDPTKKSGVRWITEPIIEFRTVPIRIDEPPMPYLIEYVKDADSNELLFPFSRSTAFLKVRAVGERLNRPIPNATIDSSQVYNHFFRSERACQLVDDYAFDIFELDRFFGWKSGNLKTAEIYARMGWRGLARMMGVEV